jgi:hypothetical protein
MAAQVDNVMFETEMRQRVSDLWLILENRVDIGSKTKDFLHQLVSEIDCLVAVAGNRTEMLLSFAGFEQLVPRLTSHLKTMPDNDRVVGKGMLEEATTIVTLYQGKMPERHAVQKKPVRPENVVVQTGETPRMTFSRIVDELRQLVYG